MKGYLLCYIYRFSVSVTHSSISSKALKDKIRGKLIANQATSTDNVFVIKLFLNSLEYQKIHNFPMHGLQLVAEVNFPNPHLCYRIFIIYKHFVI